MRPYRRSADILPAFHRIPRALGLTSPLGRVPRVPVPPRPPRADPLVEEVVPLVDEAGARTRDWRLDADV